MLARRNYAFALAFIGVLLWPTLSGASILHYTINNYSSEPIRVECVAFFLQYKDHIYIDPKEGVCFDFLPHYFTDPSGHPAVCTIHTTEAEHRGCSYKISFNINKVEDKVAQVIIHWLPQDQYSVYGDVTNVEHHEISTGMMCKPTHKLHPRATTTPSH